MLSEAHNLPAYVSMDHSRCLRLASALLRVDQSHAARWTLEPFSKEVF